MFNVNTSSLNRLTVELKNLHKAALPNTVRFTLNDLAFDVKKNTLIKGLHETDMKIKSDSFFKKYSGVEKATGYDVEKMYSQVGMMPSLGSGTADRTIQRMKEQDEGGTLRHSGIALNDARTLGDFNKQYGFHNMAKTRAIRGREKKVREDAMRKNLYFWGNPIAYGDKQGLIKAFTKSKITEGGGGKGNVVLYGKYIYEIIGFHHIGDSGDKFNSSHKNIKIHLRKLYSYKQNRQVHLKPKHFTQKSGLLTMKKAEEIFRLNASKQLAKWQ